VQGKAVRDKAFAQKTIARMHDLTLRDAEPLPDRGIGPERAPVAVGSQVEKEKERDLLQGKAMQNVTEAVARTREGSTGSRSGIVVLIKGV
jgi:hypothetical protein